MGTNMLGAVRHLIIATVVFTVVALGDTAAPAQAKPIDDWVRDSIARLSTIRPALNAAPFPRGTKVVKLMLQIKVAKDGKIVFARVSKGSGVPAFDERARQLVLQIGSLAQPPPSPPAPHTLMLPIHVMPKRP